MNLPTKAQVLSGYRWLCIRQRNGWQRQLPVSEGKHTCQNCGTVYEGNFCPVCGQGSEVERFRWKNCFQNVLAGFFNIDNGFLRTLIDLLVRPGYMIRDYLSGHRKPYFKPFQTLFVLATLEYILLTLTFPEAIKYSSPDISNHITEETLQQATESENAGQDNFYTDIILKGNKIKHLLQQVDWPPVLSQAGDLIYGWITGNTAVVFLFFIPFLYASIRRVFRKTPLGMYWNGAETLFTIVYMGCQMFLISMFITISSSLICDLFPYFGFIIVAFWVLDFHQLFDLSWLRSIWDTILVVLCLFFFMLLFSACMAAISISIVEHVSLILNL